MLGICQQLNIITVRASLQNLCHSKSLILSKSMPHISNNGLKEKYPYVRVGTLETMHIKDILIKNS